ncbi:unnamed protein product, partial [Vitis vinifera]
MEEQTAQNPRHPPLCQECKLNPSKYTCPGCSVRSCSLPCVKAHKQQTGCTGKRQQTQFVPLSQFDDNLLLSDYNLLEEVKSVAESAQRRRVKLCGYSQLKFPYHLRGLRNAAGSRRTKLLFLPSGMSKREKNKSQYNQRSKCITWTIEWRFHSTDVVLLDHGINENSTLSSVIEKHLKPGPWNHKLKPFCAEQLDCLKFFIRKYPKGPRSPFHELDIRAPIRQQFANLAILEYPQIHVFLPSHSYDFDVIKDANPRHRQAELKESLTIDQPSPKGISFREEEIEEHGGSLDSKVLDLMQHVKSTQANKPQSSPQKKEPGENIDFDFEQGLLDVYSDIIAQINPDDFLDWEGDFSKEVKSEERIDCSDFGGVFPVEELEEGEIP